MSNSENGLQPCLNKLHSYSNKWKLKVNPRRHRGGGGGQSDPHPLDFFGLKFLFLDRLPKALAQLFFAR